MSDRSTLFKVYERPLSIIGKAGINYPVHGYKALVRAATDAEPNKPITLGVVSDSYKLIQTSEVVEHIERELTKVFGEAGMRAALIKSRIAYDGAHTYDEYKFPTNNERVLNSLVHFKVTLKNSYDGTSRVGLFVGGEYLACLNGMVISDTDLFTRRHIGDLLMPRMTEYLKRGLDDFHTSGAQWRAWSQRELAISESEALLKAAPNSNETLITKLRNYYDEEPTGRTLWGMYNAGTAYATHGAIRRSTNDNEATIRMDRTLFVRNWTRTTEWKKLAA